MRDTEETTEALEALTISTVLAHLHPQTKKDVQKLDPELFTVHGNRGLVEAINEVGVAGDLLFDHVWQDGPARSAFVEVAKVVDKVALPIQSLEACLKRLRLKKLSRDVARASQASLGLAGAGQPKEALEVLKAQVEAPTPLEDGPPLSPTSEKAAGEYLSLLQDLTSPEGLASRIPTGFSVFDKEINQSLGSGLHLGTLGTIAARPGRGKTSVAVSLIESVLETNPNEMVGVFSLEMTHSQLAGDVVKRELRRAGKRWGQFPSHSDFAYGCARAEEKLARLRVCDKSSMGVDEMLEEAERLSRLGCRLFFVDYFQRIKLGDDVKPENVRVAYSEACLKLTEDAKQNQRCWVLLSQLSRGADTRPPTMADLKETSALEENSAWVIGLHRPVKLDLQGRPEKAADGRLVTDSTRLEVHILKNRFGPAGDCVLHDADFQGKAFERVYGVA